MPQIKKKEKNTGIAAAKECSMDAAVLEALQELAGIFTKKNKEMDLRLFSVEIFFFCFTHK